MSMREELKLIITGDNRNLIHTLRGTMHETRTFAQQVGRMNATINSGLKSSILNPIVGLGSAAGIMMLGKQIIDFDASLVRLQNTGRLTTGEMLKLRQSVVDDAMAVGQSRESIVAGISTIVDKTGNIKFAVKNIKDIGVAATATGASVEDMAALASNLNEKLDIGNISEAFNLINAQGKSGAFTLRDMASLGERLFSSATRMRMKGIDDLRQYGALIQIARMGTGSSEQATTAIERIISNIFDKQDQIKKIGFNIFGDEGEVKGIGDIVKGIIVASKGNQKLLGDIFGLEGIRAATTMARIYADTGGFDLFDKLANADAEHAGELMQDFGRYSETAAFKIARLNEVGKNFADAVLSKSIGELSNGIEKLLADPQRLAEFQNDLKNIGDLVANLAKGVMFVAKGWGLLFKGYNDVQDRAAQQSGDRQTTDVQWNLIPKDEQKKLRKRFHLGSTAGREDYYAAKSQAVDAYHTENKINLTVNVNPDGSVSTKSDSLNTSIKAAANRGIHTARQ